MLKKYVIGVTINDQDLYVEFTPEEMTIILDGHKERFLLDPDHLAAKLLRMKAHANGVEDDA